MTTETAKQHKCQTFNNKVAYTYLLHNIFIDIQREREINEILLGAGL